MSTRSLPEPRPALRRAKDGSIHPAAPSQSSLAVDAAPVAAEQARRGGKPSKQDRKRDGEEQVTVVVTLPRSTRKRLRRRAETYGWSVEEAAAHVLRVWADG